MDDTSNAEGQVNDPAKPEVETLESVQDLEPSKPKDDTVPLKKYMAEKDARREAEANASKLQEEIALLRNNSVNMSVGAVNDEIRRIAAKHQVSDEFLADVFAAARKVSKEELSAEIDAKVNPKLTQIEQERLAEQREKKFEQIYAKTLKEMPEYDGIVSREAIKALAFNPANAKKTLPQIIEETYSNALQGKRTLERGNAGKNPPETDYRNPTEDDWQKIQGDPTEREKWSKETQDQLRRII